ncbi:uncharacterized protein N7515_001738 [Penicillium bovifimosum]|uniref:Uncharacterized protein n=1 Tax=Penicillium bovifimosum TaxID=126998 RepID=A0A9W9L8N6_9EURO|nr:uncharacterized protein N7515_001738 [Penicillium bovifimosum]KAJ5142951.1 hypothetical protein N7515_001738 [Penicillium bovifimosum]
MNLLQVVVPAPRRSKRIAARNARDAAKKLAEKTDNVHEEKQAAKAVVKPPKTYVITVDWYEGSLRARGGVGSLRTNWKGLPKRHFIVEVPKEMGGDFEAARKLKGAARSEALMGIFRRIEGGDCDLLDQYLRGGIIDFDS